MLPLTLKNPGKKSNFSKDLKFDDKNLKIIEDKKLKTSLTLSPAFQSAVEVRTQSLISSLKQYDKKREHNLNLLAGFF
jgi:hypothetical protein